MQNATDCVYIRLMLERLIFKSILLQTTIFINMPGITSLQIHCQ